MMRIRLRALTKGAAICAATAVALAACAGTPPANENIAVAKASVQRAEQSGAPEFAPVELATARDKVTRAEKLNADQDGKAAGLLADQANMDAQVAEATARQERAHQAAMEFDASMRTFRQETMHSSPPTQ